MLLKKAPAVSPAKPFTDRSPGSMMPAMLMPDPKTYWFAVPRGQMPPPTVEDPVAQIWPVGEDAALHPVHREDVLRAGEEAESPSRLRLRHGLGGGGAERQQSQGRPRQQALTEEEHAHLPFQ